MTREEIRDALAAILAIVIVVAAWFLMVAWTDANGGVW